MNLERIMIICIFVLGNQSGYHNYKTNNMNKDEQIKTYLMQSIALANYAKLCIRLNEVPRIKVINQLENCEDVKKLHESNQIFLDTIKQLDDLDKM